VVWIIAAAAMFSAAVLYAVHHAPKPKGYSGLEFAPLTPAAAARTPLLPKGGALVQDVADNSPAARARISAGEVVAAIDGVPIRTARQAAGIVRRHRAGDRILLTLYDITQGEVRPQTVPLTFDAAPPVTRKLSVRPPRILAKEAFLPPPAAANAAWSRRILRGATIRPLPLAGLGAGRCTGFAPEEWRVAAHAPDNALFHVMADKGFAHAIYASAVLKGGVDDFLLGFLRQAFGSPAILTPPQARPFGFVERDFGNRKGGAGFLVYRVTGRRIALWLAAVPAGDVGWAKPLAGAVALTLTCAAPGAPAPVPRPAELLAARISLHCIRGACRETDFAATYLTVLRKGYVHNIKGEMFLVNPRRDFWQSGAEGPGFYHQTGGENERLYPGRIN
jgi:hypothetical protein